jgi:diaminopimelate epimerase
MHAIHSEHFLSKNFAKYHGNANDFIIFMTQTKEQMLLYVKNNASQLCDRYRGIGADGILVLSATDYGLDMSVINKDGSEAKNCGNGLRCAARWYFDRNEEKSEITISLGQVHYLCSKVGDHIFVPMGEAQLVSLDTIISHAKAYKINLQNNHIVFVFHNLVINHEIILEEVRHKIKNWHDYNIGLLTIRENNFYSRVFERGVGFTYSCGSGACAAAAALSMGYSQDHVHELMLSQPGGPLWVRVQILENKGDNARFMLGQRGEAQAIFRGNL